MFSIQQQLTILTQTDSTNNYAMARIRAGVATHGQAWFAMEQTAGKGQREKRWLAEKGANILLSIALEPEKLGSPQPFIFNASVAIACHDFFKEISGDETTIKWPNDIYWRDRKAGGILIENIYSGEQGWTWSVVGIGLNINQTSFSPDIKNAVSLKQITGKDWDVLELTRSLCSAIENRVGSMHPGQILNEYNARLFKKNESVKFRKENRLFDAVIKGVNALGELEVSGAITETFRSGEVEWII